MPRLARVRRAWSRIRVGARRRHHDHAPAQPGRPHGADRGCLRRRLPDDLAGLRAQGLRLRLPPRGRVRRPELPSRRAHSDRLDRDAVESAAEHRRHQEGGGRGACGRRDPRRRQHLCDALSAAASGARRGHRRALDDQVPRWTLGRRRRFRRDERSDDRRTASVPPEVPGSRPGPDGLLARAARESRRSLCACASTVTALMHCQAFSNGIHASSRPSIRGSRGIPATRSPRSRCTTSAA